VVGSIVVAGGSPAHDSHPGAVALFASMTNIVGLHDHRPHAQDVQEAMTHIISELAAVLATALFIFARTDE
jgi:hypothetical protein